MNTNEHEWKSFVNFVPFVVGNSAGDLEPRRARRMGTEDGGDGWRALSVRASADASGRTERVPSAEIRVHPSSFVVETCGRPEDGGIWNREWEAFVTSVPFVVGNPAGERMPSAGIRVIHVIRG